MEELTNGERKQKFVEYEALELLIRGSSNPEVDLAVYPNEKRSLLLLKTKGLVEMDDFSWELTEKGKIAGKRLVINSALNSGINVKELVMSIINACDRIRDTYNPSQVVDNLVKDYLK